MDTPVSAIFGKLWHCLDKDKRVILTAETGSGKTTRVPLFLMERFSGTILILEPRRIAVRSAAKYMASLLGETVGNRIGYRVRNEQRIGKNGRIEVITEGMLTRKILADPELSDVSCVIFDEFHERSIHSDTGLALCMEIQQALRPDLALLVMSATLDTEELSKKLSCSAIHAEGRSYPVEIRYRPCPKGAGGVLQSIPELLSHTAGTIRHVLATEQGSVLVFLPGQGEIKKVAEMLDGLPPDVSVYPLYANLPATEQDKAISPLPADQRKVVLASAVAQTSLTIEGIRVVIDSGLARNIRFNPGTNMNTLVTERVTADTAEQRAGRAGRMDSGICIRLWNEGDLLLARHKAEIEEADLTPFLLNITAWGAKAEELMLPTPPPPAALQHARETLLALNAVKEENGRLFITEYGGQLSTIPAHPRLAHILLSSGDHAHLAAAIAAIVDFSRAWKYADIRYALAELPKIPLLRQNAEQLFRIIAKGGTFSPSKALEDEDEAGNLLALAFPERIAKRTGQGRYLLAGGRQAELPSEDLMAKQEFLAVGALDGGLHGVATIRLAAPFDFSNALGILRQKIRFVTELAWDAKIDGLSAKKSEKFGALLLSSTQIPLTSCDEKEKYTCILRYLADNLQSLPWSDELRQWQQRVLFLRYTLGDEWPDVSDKALSALLKKGVENPDGCFITPWLAGVTNRQQISRLPLKDMLHSLLPYGFERQLVQMAPTHITVPSGSSIRLEYGEKDVVLAVKLQEMFGLAEGPSVCGGKFPVTIHLLSPARRPLQVTRDLAGFWKNGYLAVRAEMRGRYPKHPWPEDPWNFMPTAKTNKALGKEKNT